MFQNFNINSYYSRLKTHSLGRPCIYLDKVDSTIEAVKNESPNTILLAREQSKGRGQRENIWHSPPGCAMASIKLLLDKNSFIAKKICFLQHITALEIAKTLHQIDRKKLSKDYIKLKWPNDILYKNPLDTRYYKLAGILVHSEIQSSNFDVTVSFGLNVFNKQPTVCLMDIISETLSQQLSIDSIIADILNNLEDKIYQLDDDKFDLLKGDYTSRCIQVDQTVNDHINGLVKVKDVNDDGYLVGIREYDKKYCIVTKIV